MAGRRTEPIAVSLRAVYGIATAFRFWPSVFTLRPLSPHACLGVSLLRLGLYSFYFSNDFSCPSCAAVSFLACCSFRFVFWCPFLRTRFLRNIFILAFVSVLLPCPRPGAPFVGMALRLYLGVCFSLCSPRLVLLHSFT